MKKRRNKKKWFSFYLFFVKFIYTKPKYKFVECEDFPLQRAIYISNHVGSKVVPKLECHFPRLFRLWGAHQMNEGIGARFKYLFITYFNQKKHIPKFFSFFIALFVLPIMTLFYKGARFISTYTDMRFSKTIKESIATIENDESIVIFPENSSDGYHDELKEFHPGFYMIADKCYQKGIDLPIVKMYFQKKKNQFIVDKPIMFSKIKASGKSRTEVAEEFRIRVNELGKMDL